jgi:hypothetical protein
VDAIAVLGLGVGAYLMYAAYKNEHPVQRFEAVLFPSAKLPNSDAFAIGQALGQAVAAQAPPATGPGPTTVPTKTA